MPELPDVILEQRNFKKHFLKKTIKNIEIKAPKLLPSGSEKTFIKTLIGEVFTRCEQHGKHLFLATSGKMGVALHFGMTGTLSYGKSIDEAPSYNCMTIEFEKDFLFYSDRRRLGKLSLVGSMDELIKEHKLGPDALKVGLKEFQEILSAKTGKIKPVLLDQSLVAGLGNVYIDEVLWQARIHPESSVKAFTDKEFKLIHSKIAPILEKAIELDGERGEFPKGKYLISHREEGELCPRDKEKLIVKSVGGRTTFFCNECQGKY